MDLRNLSPRDCRQLQPRASLDHPRPRCATRILGAPRRPPPASYSRDQTESFASLACAIPRSRSAPYVHTRRKKLLNYPMPSHSAPCIQDFDIIEDHNLDREKFLFFQVYGSTKTVSAANSSKHKFTVRPIARVR